MKNNKYFTKNTITKIGGGLVLSAIVAVASIGISAKTAYNQATELERNNSAQTETFAPMQAQSVKGDIVGYVFRNGQKQPAANVNPGEVILWELTLKNESSQAVRGIAYDGDIPTSTVYLNNSATGTNDMEFSLDGNNFSRFPQVQNAQGKLVAAPVEMYKAVRFKTNLAGGESKVFTYKTTVK